MTLGGDKNYDTRDFVDKLREAAVTPHVAQNQHARRSSAIDQRTTQQPGYAISQRKRKRVEEIFGWIKTIGGLRKTRHRGKRRVGWMRNARKRVHLRGGGLQSGSHEKPGASSRLRSRRAPVSALEGRQAATNHSQNSDHNKGINPHCSFLPQPVRSMKNRLAQIQR